MSRSLRSFSVSDCRGTYDVTGRRSTRRGEDDPSDGLIPSPAVEALVLLFIFSINLNQKVYINSRPLPLQHLLLPFFSPIRSAVFQIFENTLYYLSSRG